MGQKIHPGSLRLPLTRDWKSKWFATKKDYPKFVLEDHKIRSAILKKYGDNAGIADIYITRSPKEINLQIKTSKPGILIGRQGKGIEELRAILDKLISDKVKIDILEVKNPDLNAKLVAANIGNQISKRISFRRAVRQALERSASAGAKGVKITVSGRLSGTEIARRETSAKGTIPASSLNQNISFAVFHAKTTYGVIGVKVWIHIGKLAPSDQEDLTGKERL